VIVSSDVNNIAELSDYLEVANNSTDFIAALKRAVTVKVDTTSSNWQQAMNGIAWDSRIDSLLKKMDGTLNRRLKKSA